VNTYENILTEVGDGIGTVTLNRPEKLNAFAGKMRQEVAEAVRELIAMEDVRVLVITGSGRAFCAGADIDYMKELTAAENYEAFGDLVDAGRDVVTAIRGTDKPVIASVNGPAAGGGANLALCCDIRIASDTATIGETFNNIGLHPDWGGTFFLPRLVGISKALELVFTGEMIDAQEAHRIGIFNRVVSADKLPQATEDLARTLADKPPIAMALAKKALYQSANADLEAMLAIEFEYQMRCFKSADAGEGLNAFLEKRKPNFQGK
jgi:enoyl-CoA hydratase/carnithine racemase